MKRYGKYILMIGSVLILSGCKSNTNNSTVPEENHAIQNDTATQNSDVENKESVVSENGSVTDKDSKEEKSENTAAENQEEMKGEGTQYTWNEMTITIPAEWKDLYVVKEEQNGFYFLQKSSNEKEEGSGYLCGYYRYEHPAYDIPGETMLAYTKDYVYCEVLPTDVSYYYEDKAISDEFGKMAESIYDMKDSLIIHSDSVFYDPQEYVLPMSNFCKLTEDDLLNLNDNDLWIARNELYARYGYQFKNSYLQQYFNRCSWYEPKENAGAMNETVLNENEKANLKLIQTAEEQYQKNHPYPKKESTDTKLTADLNGDGKDETFSYQVKTKGDDYVSILTVDGKDFDLDDYIYMDHPIMDRFYLTDINSYEDGLELAVLDEGPSEDPETYFFTYDGELHLIGSVTGFPFRQEGNLNGFADEGGVTGVIRTDIIHTCYSYGYWYYDAEDGQLVYQDGGYHKMLPEGAHELYVDLPVYRFMDVDSSTSMIKACKEVYFMITDGAEWIQVRTKDGSEGYVHLRDGKVVDLNQDASEVFSDLAMYD